METILARCAMMRGMADALKAEGFKDTGTVMQQAADTIVNLAKLVQYIYDEGYGDDWFAEQAEALGFEPNF